MSINLLTTPKAEQEAAFDLLEGNGFYARSAADTWYECIGGVMRKLVEGNFDGLLVIHGNGGWHRYFVRRDGTVLADEYYGVEFIDAVAVGFDMR